MTTPRDPRRAFVPGEWLGPVALGTREKPSGKDVVDKSDKLAGERAAKIYPWMTVIPINMPSSVAGTIRRVTRGDPGSVGEVAFVNSLNRNVYLKEIRFMAMAPQGTTTFNFDLVRRFGATIKHTNYDITRDFLPLYALATYNNYASPNLDGAMSFTLPTVYAAPLGNGFTMIARNTVAPVAGGGVLGIGINGSDHNGNPYVLAREGLPGLVRTVYQFTENTGAGTLKNCFIERVNFNVSRSYTDQLGSFLWGLQTEVQFVPPEGPKWHSANEWFPVNGIVDQAVSTLVNNDVTSDHWLNQDIVSYRPVAPHILTPRQTISIDLMCYQAASYFVGAVETFVTPIWVVMLGTQEALT